MLLPKVPFMVSGFPMSRLSCFLLEAVSKPALNRRRVQLLAGLAVLCRAFHCWASQQWHRRRVLKLLLVTVAMFASGCGCNRQPTDRQASKLIRAIEAGNILLTDKILAEGVDVNGQDSAGMTPLLQSLLSGNEAIYKRLLEKGANPNVCNKVGQCVMNEAADRDGPWLEMALKHGGDPNALNNGNPYFPNSTPLFYAISPPSHLGFKFQTWQIHNVELLISAGANINHQDLGGTTPLLRAAESGGYEIVVKLLLASADPTLANKYGQSTVDWFDRRDTEMVREEQKPWFLKAQEILVERGLLNTDGSKRRQR
ncbi:MAG: ankyrin repeat domain-containing protein [Pirellulales bacterium]